MPRWFLSYHSPDEKLAACLKSPIEDKDSEFERLFRADGPLPRRRLDGSTC